MVVLNEKINFLQVISQPIFSEISIFLPELTFVFQISKKQIKHKKFYVHVELFELEY